MLALAASGAAMLGFHSSPVMAQASTNLCTPEGITFIYFNGVNTTAAGAASAAAHIRSIYGEQNAAGDRITYETFYNATGGLAEDLAETFNQRLHEQGDILRNRMELFFQALRGGGSWTDRISSVFTTFGQTVDAFQDYQNRLVLTALAALIASPPTSANYAAHRLRLDTLTLQGSRLLFFAHSQGNLFANSAYGYARTKVGPESLGLVHVAPASVALNGPYTLADKDLVISLLLNLVGAVPASTTTIPDASVRPAGLNGQRDDLGHGLLEIYLNPALATRGRIDGQVRAALNSLVAPVAEGQQGFFTVTLTWNGSGDVDLHTFEPNGTHVYYLALQGTSGFLDVDNVTANGPEHYYASCDASRLQTGTYRIGINNFARASGRTATVQVSSYRAGPLVTRSLSVGGERGTAGNAAPIPVVSVIVTRDPQTGAYSVSYQ